MLRCVQSCHLSCGAGESIWRPSYSSDSCQSPATLQAEFRKQGATFHSRRQLARAGLGGQTLISSSSSATPLPRILLILQPPPLFPFYTPQPRRFMKHISIRKKALFPSTNTTLIYKTTLTLLREFRNFGLKY